MSVGVVIVAQGLIVALGGLWGATLGVGGGLPSLVLGVVGIALGTRTLRHRGERKNSLWSDAWRRLRKNRMALGCGIAFYVICVFSFLGPTLAQVALGLDPIAQDAVLGAVAPNALHWFGTDDLGRDMMVRTMVGGQLAIAVGVTATLVALIIGVAWGAFSAFMGGKIDDLMMRIVDVLYAFPVLVFVIVIQAILDTSSLIVLFALIGGIRWLNMARIVRGQVLSLREQEFVEAARCLGAPTWRILLHHIVPNTLGVIIVYSTLSLPSVMLTEAFLSFLGLGVQAPLASWGTLLTEGKSMIVAARWVLIFPGLLMGATIFALNFLGDGLRDALDPQMRK